MRTPLFVAAVFSVLTFSPLAWAETPVYSVSGNIAGNAEVAFGTEQIAAIGETEIITRIFVLDENPRKVKGVLMRDLIHHVGGKGSLVRVKALDGYEMEIPIEDFQKYDVVLATRIDGETLSVREKGPAWIIYPISDHPELNDPIYEARSVWQVKSIEVE